MQGYLSRGSFNQRPIWAEIIIVAAQLAVHKGIDVVILPAAMAFGMLFWLETSTT
jgi:uncharacterized membrane protein